ncbi:cytochrome c oxidase assembly protein [Ornithinibacillus scapharcae]|uniref:cytochrome c oxidase assembly protein n=1 Tax=Ornithinibacillus scapharcae TaxID=1147159 RepID=UPI000225AD49|nr:cytochrome c oxidase assembly protein [Ornithinibacillus scapharcae]
MLDIMLEEFPFSSLWNAGVFLFIAFTAVIYLFLLPQEKGHSFTRKVSFLFGLVLIFIAAGSPLNIFGRIQFSAHIIQVIILSFIAPPLLVIGMKYNLFKKLPLLEKSVLFMSRPYIAISLFFLVLYAYHYPPIFDQARVDLYGNYIYLFLLFGSAMLLWGTLIPIPGKKQLLYYHLFCVLGIIPLGIILMLSKDVLYHAYTDLDTFTQALQVCLPPGQQISEELVLLILPFQPIPEQHLGGVIWIIAGFISFIASFIIKSKKKD